MPSLNTALSFDKEDVKLSGAAEIRHDLQAAKQRKMKNVWFSPKTAIKDLTLSLSLVQKTHPRVD